MHSNWQYKILSASGYNPIAAGRFRTRKVLGIRIKCLHVLLWVIPGPDLGEGRVGT